MWSTAEIFGAPVIDPPGNVASSSSVSPTSSRSRPSTARDEVLDARQSARRHQLRPAHGARLAHAREVVALEVDDHHVLGRVLLRLGQPLDTPGGRVPLIGIVQTRRPRRARKSSGEAETIAQPSPTSGRGASGRSGASARRERRRVAAERRREVLDEVHLVDVAGGDRVANGLDRSARTRRRSRSAPTRPTRPSNTAVARTAWLVCGADVDGGRRQRARLGRRRRRGRGGALREAVAEVDVGDETVGAALEEPFAAQGALDLRERAKLLHGPTLTSRRCCASPPCCSPSLLAHAVERPLTRRLAAGFSPGRRR